MTKNGPQLTNNSPIHVAIASYPGAQATCINGLTDLFTYADHFAREHAAQTQPMVRVTHWSHSAEGGALECIDDSDPGPPGKPAVVIMPACQMAPPKTALAPQSVDSVEQVAAAAGYEDSGGFRRIFKRVVGLSPAEYRRRFQRAAPRTAARYTSTPSPSA